MFWHIFIFKTVKVTQGGLILKLRGSKYQNNIEKRGSYRVGSLLHIGNVNASTL
jgi:hypothetical protein